MDTSNILAVLRAERDQIDFAIAALEALGGGASAVKSTPKGVKAAQVKAAPTVKKRVISAAARKKMSEAAKERWAAKKKTAKPKASAKQVVPKKAAPKTAKKRVVSPESRKKMAEAQQKRWAKKKRAVKAAAKKVAAAAPVASASVKEVPKA
jgi:hypothetical protein